MAHEKRLVILAEVLLAIIREWPAHGYSDMRACALKPLRELYAITARSDC
jgi:hypothetical protein